MSSASVITPASAEPSCPSVSAIASSSLLLSDGLRLKLKSLMFQMPGMITCAEFEEFMLDHFDDQLSNAELKVFERHMVFCRECREYLAA